MVVVGKKRVLELRLAPRGFYRVPQREVSHFAKFKDVSSSANNVSSFVAGPGPRLRWTFICMLSHYLFIYLD